MRYLLPLLLLAGASAGLAAETPKIKKQDLKPAANSPKPTSIHTPFETEACSACHEKADPKAPGAVRQPGNALCLECHEDITKIMSRKFPHAAAVSSCVNCHNPHNSSQPKLLVQNATAVCVSCHEQVKMAMVQSRYKHAPLEQAAGCVACHNPHATDVQRLLIQEQRSLCLSCHDRNDTVDAQGQKLANLKRVFEENPKQHGPVESEPCSACHKPHGSANFRLLTKAYPAQFYSGFSSKAYELCFDCHEESAFTAATGLKETNFRDGESNLHYLHVNKPELGRSCRACHEVHASKQEHQIRDSVPYGRGGWLLKVNFTKTTTGGSCAKTCHSARTYDNGSAKGAKKE